MSNNTNNVITDQEIQQAIDRAKIHKDAVISMASGIHSTISRNFIVVGTGDGGCNIAQAIKNVCPDTFFVAYNTSSRGMTKLDPDMIYAALMIMIAYICKSFKNVIDANKGKRRITTYVVASCFIVAFASEAYFGIADITGAYLLGLFLSQHEIKHEIAKKVSSPSYLFFSPIFFASVGLKVSLDGFNSQLLTFSLLLLLVAILTKIIGCGIGAKLCGFDKKESIQVGVGMISRGEVALIVAQKGYDIGLIDANMFPPIVIVVIATTVITPIVLKKIM